MAPVNKALTPNATSTLTIYKIDSVEALYREWPAFLGSLEGKDADTTLRQLLECLDHGVIFSCSDETGFQGFAAAVNNGQHAHILCIPTKIGKQCMAALRDWARTADLAELRISSNQFNGSNFKYLEKTLGFRRQSITFSTKV